VWAVRTKYAESLWNQPPTEDDCKPPTIVSAVDSKRLGLSKPQTIVDFVIPAPRR
jgi:hypothetical protein